MSTATLDNTALNRLRGGDESCNCHSEADFAMSVAKYMEIGSLKCLEDLRDRDSQEGTEARSPRTMAAIRRVVEEWTAVEHEHGECAMLDADHAAIRQAVRMQAGLLCRDQTLLESSRRLKEVKGPVWWEAKHSLENYL